MKTEPNSHPAFDEILKKHLISLNPNRFLDVGAGAGTYGKLVREMFPDISTLTAIEPTLEYVEDYKLSDIYDTVHKCSVQEFLEQNNYRRYDVVYCSDVLEHLFLSEAIDIIDSLLYYSNWIILKWPTELFQGWLRDNQYEKHKSNIRLKDLQRFNIHYYSKTPIDNWELHYAVISAEGNKILPGLTV